MIQAADHSHIELEAWPEVDLTAAAEGGNGAALGLEGLPANGNGYHENWNGATTAEPVEESDAAARLAFLSGEVAEPAIQPAEPVAWIGEEPAVEAAFADDLASAESAVMESAVVEPAVVEPERNVAGQNPW